MLPVDLDLVLHRPDILMARVSKVDACGITVLAPPIPVAAFINI